MAILEGWVDDVEDGWVHGRFIGHDGAEVAFYVKLLNVMDSQRVSLQPGSYVYIVNNELMVNNAIWTTHDIERADKKAQEWAAFFRS